MAKKIYLFNASIMLISTLCSIIPNCNSAEDYNYDYWQKSLNKGLCSSKFIRNTAESFLELKGCRVIEGNLQIGLIHSELPSNFLKYSFPELREISGYFLLTSVDGLETLRNLFPNLAVIRGQDSIYDFAFLVHDVPNLIQIGLPSLTHVLNRRIFINGNPKLCYVDTIDWELITNGTHQHKIMIDKNEASGKCEALQICPANCTGSQNPKTSKSLCWTSSDCQKIPDRKFCDCKSGLCYDENKCCSPQCLGGCVGPAPTDCYICKHFENYFIDSHEFANKSFICMGHCEAGTLEFSGRRCIKEDECSNITRDDPIKKKRYRGRILRDQNKCVLECPQGYISVISSTKQGVRFCEKCNGSCKKTCRTENSVLKSIERVRELKGCTKIYGSLKIQIRGYSPNLMSDLRNILDMVEEINGTLIITNSHSITSLEFLKSLRVIHGVEQVNNHPVFALEVKSNDNLMDLWGNQTVLISNPTARVQFHYNPKLCAIKIWDFVDKSKILKPTDNKIDIGITNGDRVPCHQLDLPLYEVKKLNDTISIKWGNFRSHMIEPAHLLNYEVYYKLSLGQNASIYEDRDACGYDDWTVFDVEKMEFDGPQSAEPNFESPVTISGLSFYTQYAFYVKTVVIPFPDETNSNSTKHNIGGISSICYITTLPSVPSKPRNVKISSPSANSIKLEWAPPEKPNGVIEKYDIFVNVENPEVIAANQPAYCNARPDLKVMKKPDTSPLFTSCTQDCSSCTAKSSKKNVANKELLENDILEQITGAILIERSRRRRSIQLTSPVLENSDDPDSNMKLFKTIYVNEGKSSGPNAISNGNLEYLLEGLDHYTNYTVGIRVCRDSVIPNTLNGCKDPNSTTIVTVNSQGNEYSQLCSEIAINQIHTLYSETADLIDPDTIFINVTSGSVSDSNNVLFSWKEPKNPNGMIMAYKIKVMRVVSDESETKKSDEFHEKCVTLAELSESGDIYKYPELLSPGNYSLKIRAISLAPYNLNWTMQKYFYVDKDDKPLGAGAILAIILAILIVSSMSIGITVYVIKKRSEVGKIVSANPQYFPNVNIPEHLEVPPGNIELRKLLASGSFGDVYEGILTDWKGNGRSLCAVKTVAKNATNDDHCKFLMEASMMTKMNCHHVVKLLGVVSLWRPTYVIMELMTFGDLKSYLKSKRSTEGGNPPTLSQILRMSAEIADGMAYLHDNKYVHRDLAARNCLVALDLTVKVGDFGMTKDVIETEYYRKETQGLLPVRWMAPESIQSGIFTVESDVWSFGIVLWEMATLAAQPYHGLDNRKLFRYIRNGGILERPENCPDILYNMMHRCWERSTIARPTFTDILEWLSPEIGSGFPQVSYYHSPASLKFRTKYIQFQNGTMDSSTYSNTETEGNKLSNIVENNDYFTDLSESEDEIVLQKGHETTYKVGNSVKLKSISASLVSTNNLPTAFPSHKDIPSPRNIIFFGLSFRKCFEVFGCTKK